MTRDNFHDLETRSPTPIRSGSHAYLEKAEIMLWAYAGEEGEPRVWDLMSGSDWYYEDLTDDWVESKILSGPQPDGSVFGVLPWGLGKMLHDPDALTWFQNGGMFDFPVLMKHLPHLLPPMARWRDTMILAYLHGLPGALEKLGAILEFEEGDKKLVKDGKRLIQLFCTPDKVTGVYRDRATHPDEWKQFVVYAARDIRTMRVVRQKLPKWNDTPKQWALWQCNLRTNYRGFQVDTELATAALATAEAAKKSMAGRVSEITDGDVGAATQRDKLLKWILESHGVDLPDLRADTLERRIEDPDLPIEVKELLHIRLRASMNSPAKFKTVLRAMSADSRMRGTMQFRGAARTGRDAHRLFQPGNMVRPTMPWPMIKACIAGIKLGTLDLIWDNPMEACSNAVRSTIIASPGHKLVVADLASIEGRVTAWLAGEESELEMYRRYDAGTGPDAYVTAYAEAFNVDPQVVIDNKKHGDGLMRQIGKCMVLMFGYGGGVGAWVTGAATYGIDLNAMTKAVFDTLPKDVVNEASSYLSHLYETAGAMHTKAALKLWVQVGVKITAEEYAAKVSALDAQLELDKEKARYGLDERVFITCDSIKRLWRRSHPRISSYWKETEVAVREAIANPGTIYRVRKVRVKRSGSWLRIALPSGRELCYPNIRITKGGDIAYTGRNQYSRRSEEITTYGGKFVEQQAQAVANDQFMECAPLAEAAGYNLVLGVHDEWVGDPPNTNQHTAAGLAEIMTSALPWNRGIPLSAAGDESFAYHK